MQERVMVTDDHSGQPYEGSGAAWMTRERESKCDRKRSCQNANSIHGGARGGSITRILSLLSVHYQLPGQFLDH